MTKPRWVVYAEVKKAVSIEQVLIYYGLLEGFTRRGEALEGPCPIHRGQNRRHFRVSLAKNAYNCFGTCGDGGNVLDFVARFEGVEIREAALMLVRWFDLAETAATRKPNG